MATVSILKEIKINKKDTKALAELIDAVKDDKEVKNNIKLPNIKIKGLDV